MENDVAALERELAAEKEESRRHYRALSADARAALRMIREVVELHAPPGSVPSEEWVEPPLIAEAEVIVKGILAIVKAAEQC